MSNASDRGLRIAAAIRELRRTIVSGRLRARAYGDISDVRQMDALDVLAQQDGIRIGELAAALRVDNSTATRAVQQLEAQGLAERSEDRHDARAVVATLTPHGRGRHDEVSLRRRHLMRRLLAGFTVEEQELFVRLIERLVAAMDAEADGRERPLGSPDGRQAECSP